MADSQGTRYPLWMCPACDYHGIQGVTGGVGEWPGDSKVRCPSRTCEYATVMERVGVLAASSAAEDRPPGTWLAPDELRIVADVAEALTGFVDGQTPAPIVIDAVTPSFLYATASTGGDRLLLKFDRGGQDVWLGGQLAARVTWRRRRWRRATWSVAVLGQEHPS